jgi:3-oxoacyl-[acyl-carrier-protein] synthase-3
VIEYVSVVRGVGGYLPAKVLTNDDLGRMVETSDEWITERTGIKKRHIAADGETTSDLATAAVCSGFVYAIATADNFLARGQFERALVIGAETFSRIIDWSDRGTCVLFGDGAGAIVLERQEKAKAGDRGVKSVHLRSDGRYKDLLWVDGGPSSTQTVGHLRMTGNQVFKHAVSKISESVRAATEMAGIGIEEVDWFVPHQANQRILSAVAEKLGLDDHKVVSTVAEHGNTSAASVPLALAVAIEDGRVKQGDLVLIEAIGGGFAWGAALIRM